MADFIVTNINRTDRRNKMESLQKVLRGQHGTPETQSNCDRSIEEYFGYCERTDLLGPVYTKRQPQHGVNAGGQTSHSNQ